MRINRAPTTWVLLFFSWLIAILGFLGGCYLFIFKLGEFKFLSGVFLILASLLLATVIRMFANIGQIIFDIKIDNTQNLQALIQRFSSFSQENKEINKDLKNQLQSQADTLTQNLQALKDSFEQMNCDTKDMNQNIYQIKTFFEQIERHLDLKK